MFKKYLDWVRSLLSGLMRRSFNTHASLWVSDVEESLNFYKKLGFRRVMATRSEEVVLLRNHRGEELNLVSRTSGSVSTDTHTPSSVSFRVEDLDYDLGQLQSWHQDLAITEDSVSRQIRLFDPDSNVIELFEVIDPKRRSKKNIYHIATQSELASGLSEHYYVPPEGDNRFIHARARSAFMELACKRVARESGSAPLIIELDQDKLSILEEFFDESEFDSQDTHQFSTYPHVHSPVSRQAIVAVGRCKEVAGEFPWPNRFVPLDSIATSQHSRNGSVITTAGDF